LTASAANTLQPGLCDIEITDPRGQKAILQDKFYEWIGDWVAPELTIERPDPPFWPGSTIHMKVTAKDQAPGYMKALTWTANIADASATPLSTFQTGSCPVPPGSSGVDCTFDVVIDPTVLPSEQICLVITAKDEADNTDPKGEEPICFDLIPTPAVAAVTPGSGGMAGGTNVVISGRGFPLGSQVFFGDDLLYPDGGSRVDDTTITGYAPPHKASKQVRISDADVTCACQGGCDLTYAESDSVPIKVKSLHGEARSSSVFIYQSPPKVLCLDPTSGIQGQDTPISIYVANYAVSTMLYRGQTNLIEAVPLPVDPSGTTVFYAGYAKVSAILPGSSGRTTIWAIDLANGWTSLLNGFSWNAR
jgi:hypothetical protein